MNRILFSAVVALALAPAGAHGQLDRPTTPAAVLQMADRQDWLLRVSSTSGAVVEGTVESLTDSTVGIAGDRVALAEIVRIQRGERVAGGGRMGMIAGAVVLGTAFVIASSALSDDSEFDVGELGPVAAAGIVAGAIIGGLVGSDLDPPRIDWQQLWPAGW